MGIIEQRFLLLGFWSDNKLNSSFWQGAIVFYEIKSRTNDKSTSDVTSA